MRHSYLLLALVAGATTAENIVQSGRLIERDISLNPRETAAISKPVEARIVSDETKSSELQSRRQHRKRDDPYEAYLKHIQQLQEEQAQQQQQQQQQKKQDDDDDDDDHDKHPPGPPGGTIAGAVIGVLIAIALALLLWYFLRIRPRRKQRAVTAAKEAEIENYAMTPISSHTQGVSPAAAASTSNRSLPSEHVRWAPTPYPERAASSHTGSSSMSGLALPTPALTYSPSVGTATASPAMPPTPLMHQRQVQGVQHMPSQPQVHPHFDDIPSEKPPAYDAITALQSSEPQPEASAYQMGQVPVESETEVYHLPLTAPQYGVANGSGEHMPRY